MKVPYLLVDAFTTAPGGGNRAGVVLNAEGLNDAQMSKVAREIEARESVFVTQKNENYLSVRFFTPAREIEFAGHAAIALAVVYSQLIPQKGEMLFLQTQTGIVKVAIEAGEESIMAILEEPAPRFRDSPPWRVISELVLAMGADERYIHRGLPNGIAFSGLWSFFLPFIAPGLVDEIEPEMERLKELCSDLEIDTVHAYAPLGPRSYYARDFAPLLGIPEDPVTGSANGALAALLARAGVVPRREGSAELKFYQGHRLGVPSVVYARVEYSVTGEPYAVYVGGTAVEAGSGEVEI